MLGSSTFTGGSTTTGGGGAELVVASSTAPASISDRADYVCDGTNDEVQFQAAHDALPSTGGTIKATAGLFNFGAGLSITKDSVIIEGSGPSLSSAHGTVIARNAAGSFYAIEFTSTANRCELRNLGIVDTGALATTVQLVHWASGGSSLGRMFNVFMENDRTGEGALFFEGAGITLRNCQIEADDTPLLTAAGSLVDAQGCSFSAYTSGYAIDAGGGAATTPSVYLVNCSLDGAGGLRLDGTGPNLRAIGSSFVGFSSAYACLLDGSTSVRALIEGCQFDSSGGLDALRIVGSTNPAGVTVTGNKVTGADRHGIALDSVSDAIIQGNHVLNVSGATSDTYSGIILLANCDRNSIQGNVVRRAGSTPHPKYGIRIDNANCNDNFLADNDLFNSVTSGGTGAEFSDAGTDTVVVNSNRSKYQLGNDFGPVADEDTFTRANVSNGDIGSTEIWSRDWSANTGWSITSNQLHRASGYGTQVVDQHHTAMMVEVSVGAGATSEWYVIGRYTDDNNYLRAGVNNVGAYTVEVITGGSVGTLDVFATVNTAPSPANGDKFQLFLFDDDGFDVWINGVHIYTGGDTQNLTSRMVGIAANGATPKYDYIRFLPL